MPGWVMRAALAITLAAALLWYSSWPVLAAKALEGKTFCGVIAAASVSVNDSTLKKDLEERINEALERQLRLSRVPFVRGSFDCPRPGGVWPEIAVVVTDPAGSARAYALEPVVHATLDSRLISDSDIIWRGAMLVVVTTGYSYSRFKDAVLDDARKKIEDLVLAWLDANPEPPAQSPSG